jgi:tripartite ATP-independent transporter DctP family solute receptor
MKHILGTIVAAMLAATPVAAQEFTLRAGHSAAPTEPYHIGLTDFAQRVSAATAGRVAVEIFPANQLGNERESIEGVQLGTVDLAVPANAVFTNFVPDLVALDMPFLFDDQEHLERALNGPLVDAINEAAAQRGFRVLGLYTAGVRHIMTRGKAIESLADMAGLSIRTMQNPAHVAAFNAMGANATPLAYGELYGAIQAGVVDGAEAANTNYEAQKFFEVAPNWAMVSWTVLISPLIMSEAKFQSFPADIQAALMTAGRESAVIERAAYAASDAEKLSALETKGVTITRPDTTEFREAVASVLEEFIKTDAQKRMIQLIVDAR